MLFKTEVLCTSSVRDFVLVQELLKKSNIKFKVKSVNRNFYGLGSRQPILGTLGENLALETQYYVYVSPKDCEEADYLIRDWRLRQN